MFTCLILRAVHLEIVCSMNTNSFINALKQFISRCGNTEEMKCDTGSIFRSGEKGLRCALQEWNQNQVHDFSFKET